MEWRSTNISIGHTCLTHKTGGNPIPFRCSDRAAAPPGAVFRPPLFKGLRISTMALVQVLIHR